MSWLLAFFAALSPSPTWRIQLRLRIVECKLGANGAAVIRMRIGGAHGAVFVWADVPADKLASFPVGASFLGTFVPEKP